MPAVSSSTPPPWTILLPAPRAWPPLRPPIRLRPQQSPRPRQRKSSLGGATTTEPFRPRLPCVAFLAQYRASQTLLLTWFRQPSVSKWAHSCLFRNLERQKPQHCCVLLFTCNTRLPSHSLNGN